VNGKKNSSAHTCAHTPVCTYTHSPAPAPLPAAVLIVDSRYSIHTQTPPLSAAVLIVNSRYSIHTHKYCALHLPLLLQLFYAYSQDAHELRSSAARTAAAKAQQEQQRKQATQRAPHTQHTPHTPQPLPPKLPAWARAAEGNARAEQEQDRSASWLDSGRRRVSYTQKEEGGGVGSVSLKSSSPMTSIKKKGESVSTDSGLPEMDNYLGDGAFSSVAGRGAPMSSLLEMSNRNHPTKWLGEPSTTFASLFDKCVCVLLLTSLCVTHTHTHTLTHTHTHTKQKHAALLQGCVCV
jgi:hypothetical protein